MGASGCRAVDTFERDLRNGIGRTQTDTGWGRGVRRREGLRMTLDI